VTLSAQSDGSHTFYVKAKDNAGNNGTYGSHAFQIDTKPPSVTISSPAEGEKITSSNVTLTWSGLDNVSGLDKFEIKLDSGTWIDKGTTTSHTFNGVTVGNHTIYARATDKAGQSKEYQTSFSISTPIEQVATPTFSPGGGAYSSTQYVSITCNSEGSTIHYTTNGAEPTSFSTMYTAPVTVNAAMTIKAKAFESGMTDSATASAIYKIQLQDHIPPTLSVVLNSQNTVFTIVVDDNANGSGIASVTLYIDWNVVQTWTTNGTYTYSGGPYFEGRHTYYVEALDNANNIARDPTAGLREFIVSPEQVQTATNQPIELHWVLTFACLVALCTACFLVMKRKKK
jgi:hypothetical protein